MSANELLEQVKQEFEQMPPIEREVFLDKLLDLAGARAEDLDEVTSSDPHWPDVRARHRRIFGDAILVENIVTSARAEG